MIEVTVRPSRTAASPGGDRRRAIKVYHDRILRGTHYGGFYSVKKLGAFGADLGAVACFFEDTLEPGLAQTHAAVSGVAAQRSRFQATRARAVDRGAGADAGRACRSGRAKGLAKRGHPRQQSERARA